MAPIKFEDNIREKLESREIAPSNDAWNKLSKQLDATSEKKTNKVIWYAIAASFIGILIAVSVFSSRNGKVIESATDFVKINTSESEGDVNEAINTDTNASEVKSNVQIASDDLDSVKHNELVNSEIEKILPKKKEASLQDKIQSKKEGIAKISEHSINKKMSQLPENDVAKVDHIIDKKVKELVAQVELIQQNNEAVSLAEIDSLLANALGDLQSQKVITSSKINPSTLLDDVEIEMDNSFRDKVFTALGDGYDIIKTAVVNRNN